MTKADEKITATAPEAELSPRKRGRPPGSKNKKPTLGVPQLSVVSNTSMNPAVLANNVSEVEETQNNIEMLEISDLMPAIQAPSYERKSYDVTVLNSLRGKLNLNPEYQRNAGVWTTQRRSKFIETLIQGWVDVPKIYLRKIVGNKGASFEVTDGKQRLTTIFDFLDNRLKLSRTDIPTLRGKKFKDLPVELRERFMNATLDTVILQNYDESHIRHMFLLLQQGVKTNAQEDRNASMSYVRDVVASLAGHEFFRYVDFTDLRLGFQQVASQLLLITLNKGEPTNISKNYINEMYNLFADEETYRETLDAANERVSNILSTFSEGLTGFEELPSNMLSKGGVITLFTVYAKILKSTGVEDVPTEFMDNYVDFYKEYMEKRTSSPTFIKYDNYVGGGGDSENSIKSRRDIVLEHIQDFTMTLPEQDNEDCFIFAQDYVAIRNKANEDAEAMAEHNRLQNEREKEARKQAKAASKAEVVEVVTDSTPTPIAETMKN